MSAAILSRWTGAVSESDRPYQSTRPWPANAAPLPSDPLSVYLENVLYLGGTFDGPAVKNAIMTYGAVVVSMKWDSVNYSPYNETHSSFYIPEKTSTGGHAVTLAGWDDNYPVTNFNTVPPSKGAWLVKNSWGERWGDGGYFWLSYSDPNIKAPAVFLGSNGTNFKRVYQYDPNGWTGNFAPVPSETAWLANVFQAAGPSEAGSVEVLEAVSFYAGASGTSYRIEVRTNLSTPFNSPRNGVPAAEKEGVLPAAGYHTVKIPEAVLQEGSRFSIVLRLTTPGYRYPVPVEMPIEGYSEKATAGSGQSYASSDGAHGRTSPHSLPETNVCIKAFTSDRVTAAPPSAPSSPDSGGEGGGGGCSTAGTSPLVLALAIPLLFLFRK
ncbi:lectin like domain-containing protein [Aminivibrio sp.]|uniref:lectin like domain-containing protein n=1 Tax=Aminivibrio sp. TaxID=1872489 RepID=UPI00345F0337